METQIAKRDAPGPVEPSVWQAMKEQAGVMIKSGFLPQSIRTPEQCLAIAMTGKELGIGFMESIRSINVIQGKPTVSPQLMLALANRTRELEDIKINSSNEKAIVTILRKGRSPHTSEFGIAEATGLGLMGKDNYKKQPKTMFVWRALAANLRVTFPDVVLGMYTPEELGAEVDVAENGEMQIVNRPAPVAAPAARPPAVAPEAATPTSADIPNEGQEPAEEEKITAADWTEVQLLAKRMNVGAEPLKAQLKRAYGIDAPRDLPKAKLYEFTKWVRGEII